MERFNLPIYQNPLKTRSDVVQALLSMMEPVKAHFTPGFAGIHLGDHGAHYGEKVAEMEAFSRMLWGMAPLWSQGEGEEYLPLFREGLVNGTNPEHPAYWGQVRDYDQRIVEMAAIALTLMLCGKKLRLTDQEAKNLHTWLSGVDGKQIPRNNWYFFRVLVHTAFITMGWDADLSVIQEDLAFLDTCYDCDGWYFDGQPSQRDYYIPFGMHYYGLLYSHFMADRDPEHAEMFRQRAARFAQDYLYWFEDGGRAMCFGRSLTYRFGQCAFFSALAFAGLEALPWGVMKSRVLGNLRDWFNQPIFTSEGLLSVGYSYPNLCMSENYNAPGSPYWAFKAFLCLALPEDHPFWTSPEVVPQLEKEAYLPAARMILRRDESQVQMFPAGHSCVCQLGQVAAKYEKLVYSSRFGYSVSRGDSLEEGAFDSCLAVSEAGEDHYRMQRGFLDYRVSPQQTWRRFQPMKGVTVEVTVTPDFPSHRRDYVISTDRKIDVADGGFAISAQGEGSLCTPDMVELTDRSVSVRAPWGTSSIRCDDLPCKPVLVNAYPNTNLLFPVTRIPTLCFTLQPGVHRFSTVVTGSVPARMP